MEKEVLKRELSIPLHYQLMIILKKRIESGIYPVDSKIPNEMELCTEFQVSRPTVRRAIEELVEEGLVVKVHPKGTFVCNSGDKETAKTSESEPANTEKAAKNSLRVTFDSPLMDLKLYQAVEDFENRTGVKISIEFSGSWKNGFYSIANAIIEDRIPDVFSASNVSVPTFAQMGVIIPFDSFLSQEEKSALYQQGEISNCPYLYHDLLYGYPFFSETRLMYYRKDMFDMAGLPYPQEGWTHDDFLRICKKLTWEEEGRWGYDYPVSLDGDTLQTLMTWIMQRGGEIYRIKNGRTEPAADEPEFAEAFRWVCDLRLKHKVCPPAEMSSNYSKVCVKFLEGQIAMMIGLPSFSVILNGRLDEKEWGVVSLPRGKAHNKSYRGGMPLCISSKCRNPELAFRFIRYLTKKEILFPYIKRVGGLPPIELYSKEEIISNSGKELAPFAKELSNSTGWAHYTDYYNIGEEMETWRMPIQFTLRRVLNQQISYEHAIQYISTSIRDIIK